MVKAQRDPIPEDPSRMSQSAFRLRIKTIGSIRITRADGTDCTPRGRKARAIFALLSRAPDYARSRIWLQDKLWGEQSSKKGAASLRQSLSEIRRALGAEADVLQANKQTVELDGAAIDIDARHISAEMANQVIAENLELFEGLDVGEEQFETWLREQRLIFVDAVEGLIRCQGSTGRRGTGAGRAKIEPAIELVMMQPVVDGGSDIALLADTLQDMVAKTLEEYCCVLVRDERYMTDRSPREIRPGRHVLSLRSNAVGARGGPLLRVTLSNDAEKRTVWSQTSQNSSEEPLHGRSEEFLRQVNQAVSVTIDNFLRTPTDVTGDDIAAASALCFSAVQHFYRLGRGNFEIADRKFAQAFERHQKGVFLAWRAYLRTFMLAERLFDCRETLTDECFDLINRALELEPNNSYVASFAAQVEIIMRRRYSVAYELAKQSVRLNQSNAIGWAQLGIARAHLGEANQGFENTLFARQICGLAPYRFHLDGLSCIAGTMAGRFEDALRAGETSHAFSPTFAPSMRYLSVLYLHKGEPESSWSMVEKLRRVEHDFSYEKLTETSYPSAGLRRSGLLNLLPGRPI
jgi:DNA-binding winged helix-turn-helix (wHTH) protein